jgi:hypothetical protein
VLTQVLCFFVGFLVRVPLLGSRTAFACEHLLEGLTDLLTDGVMGTLTRGFVCSGLCADWGGNRVPPLCTTLRWQAPNVCWLAGRVCGVSQEETAVLTAVLVWAKPAGNWVLQICSCSWFQVAGSTPR